MTAMTSVAYSAMKDATRRATSAATTSYEVYRLGDLVDWQFAALKKITGFLSLAPNWDSYGSPPIPEKVVQTTKNLITGIPSGSVAPKILAVSGGAIELSWERNSYGLDVTVLPELTASVLVTQDGEALDEFMLPDVSAGTLAQLLAAWTSD